MTPRFKTIIFLASIPIIIYSVVILTMNYITPHERLSPFFGLILSYLVIAAIYIYFIKTKEEEKDLWHIYSKLHFLLIRFMGYSFFIGGIVLMISVFTSVYDINEKIAGFIMTLISILTGIGILYTTNKYKFKDVGLEDNEIRNDKKEE